MIIDYSESVKNAMLVALAQQIDAADPEPGRLWLYSATRPAAGAEITDQTLLAALELNRPCGSVADGILTLAVPIEDNNLPASGNIAWGRIEDGAGNWVADLDAGAEGSGATLELKATIVYKGGIIRITAAGLTI